MNAVSNYSSNGGINILENSYYGQNAPGYYTTYIHGHESMDQDVQEKDTRTDYWTPPSPTSPAPDECRYYQDNVSSASPNSGLSERYYNLDSGSYISCATGSNNDRHINESITPPTLGNNRTYGNEGHHHSIDSYNTATFSPTNDTTGGVIYGEFCNSIADCHLNAPHHHHYVGHHLSHHKHDDPGMSTTELPIIRVVKRRNTANKKERRRTQSINNAFADLRECIPNVPADTKLSKIKTLRLATSYIAYLMGVLENEDYGDGFKADLSIHNNRRPNNECRRSSQQSDSRKAKGRTGWPQHVWALELKQESL